MFCLFVCFWRNSPQWAKASWFTRFLDHTQRRLAFGRTPLDEWSARRRDLYLTTHNTHNRQTPVPPVGFGCTISVGQTYALDRAAAGTGHLRAFSYLKIGGYTINLDVMVTWRLVILRPRAISRFWFALKPMSCGDKPVMTLLRHCVFLIGLHCRDSN